MENYHNMEFMDIDDIKKMLNININISNIDIEEQIKLEYDISVKEYENKLEKIKSVVTKLFLKLLKLESIVYKLQNKYKKFVAILKYSISLHLDDEIAMINNHIFDYIKKEQENDNVLEIFKKYEIIRKQFEFLTNIQLYSNAISTHVICPICCSNKISIACIPCGHTYCESCGNKLHNICMFCRNEIVNKHKIYFS